MQRYGLLFAACELPIGVEPFSGNQFYDAHIKQISFGVAFLSNVYMFSGERSGIRSAALFRQ